MQHEGEFASVVEQHAAALERVATDRSFALDATEAERLHAKREVVAERAEAAAERARLERALVAERAARVAVLAEAPRAAERGAAQERADAQRGAPRSPSSNTHLLAAALFEQSWANGATLRATADLARDPTSAALQEKLTRAHATHVDKAAVVKSLREDASALQLQMGALLVDRDAEWEERVRSHIDGVEQRDTANTARLEDLISRVAARDAANGAARAELLRQMAELRATHAAEVDALHVKHDGAHVKHDGAVRAIRENSAAARTAAVRAAEAQHASASSARTEALRADHAEELNLLHAHHANKCSALRTEQTASMDALRGIANSARERAYRLSAAALSESREMAQRDVRDARERAHEVEDAVKRSMDETRERNSFLERLVSQREAALAQLRTDLESNQKIVLLLMRQQTKKVDVSAAVERSIQPLASATRADALQTAEAEEEAALRQSSLPRKGSSLSIVTNQPSAGASGTDTATSKPTGSADAPQLESSGAIGLPLSRAASIANMAHRAANTKPKPRGPPPDI